ncbi:hypothetical protein GW916_15945 [bacterium]|nr:hypothetical protein [bacterium]
MRAILNKAAIKVAYATISPDEHRPVLECVKIGNNEIMATDGVMLVRKSITTDPKQGKEILIRGKALLEAKTILKAEELIIESQDSKIATISNAKKREGILNITLTTKLLEAKFPDFTRVIPKSQRKAYVALQASMVAKIVKVTTSDSGKAIKIKVREPMEIVEMHIDDTDIYVMPYAVPEE